MNAVPDLTEKLWTILGGQRPDISAGTRVYTVKAFGSSWEFFELRKALDCIASFRVDYINPRVSLTSAVTL